jgi:hypothetical protein
LREVGLGERMDREGHPHDGSAGAGLQHASANPLQHMAAALSFQDNAVDAVAV